MTEAEIRRWAAREIWRLYDEGALVPEPRYYERDENSPGTGFWRELMPDEISYKRSASIATRDAFPLEKTKEGEVR